MRISPPHSVRLSLYHLRFMLYMVQTRRSPKIKRTNGVFHKVTQNCSVRMVILIVGYMVITKHQTEYRQLVLSECQIVFPLSVNAKVLYEQHGGNPCISIL